MFLPAWTDCSHSYLQGENWSQAWFYFQQKQQVINLYLIIETNGLTPSLAEHNRGKKLKNIDPDTGFFYLASEFFETFKVQC